MSPASPVNLTPEQRDLIERKTSEFIRGEAHVDYRKAAESVHALPIFFDWSGCMAIRPDGVVIWVDSDNPQRVRAVEDERERNIGLFQGSRRDPELGFLDPARPPDALDCPDCGRTGRIALPASLEHLSGKIGCYCGGLGWLPAHSARPDGRPRVFFREHRLVSRQRLSQAVIGLIGTLALPYFLSLLGLFPWSEINCWQDDIEVTSGRIRHTHYLLFIPVSRSVRDSALTKTLSPEDSAGRRTDWHPVVTLSPGLRHSPHYRFHGVLSQIRHLEIGWEFGKMSPEARRETARQVLRLWQQTGSDYRAGEYIQAVWERAMEAEKKREAIDVSDLPVP